MRPTRQDFDVLVPYEARGMLARRVCRSGFSWTYTPACIIEHCLLSVIAVLQENVPIHFLLAVSSPDGNVAPNEYRILSKSGTKF